MLPLPSIDTLVHTLSTCLKQSSHSAALHSCICKRGVDAHPSLETKLVLFLAKSGKMCCAQNAVFDGPAYRSASCWAALIHGYINCGDSVLALTLYRKTRHESPPLNAYTFVCLLKACAELKDLETGGLLHLHAVELRLLESSCYVGTALVDMYAKCGVLSDAHKVFDALPTRSTVLWNALIAGYVRHERFKEAVKLFDCMQAQGMPPDSITFVCILKACATLGAAEKGLDLHHVIDRMGLLPKNQFVGNALVNMYAKCGLHVKGREVLQTLTKRDVVSWNGLITGCMQHNCAEEVIHCFEQMKLEGIPPDEVTYACVLQACGNIAAQQEGIKVHADIRRSGSFEQSLVVGTALVDMYAKFGMLAEAQKAFNGLPARDVIAWSALIAGYTQHKHGEEALGCFDLMQAQGTSPNAITYACSLKACGILGAIERGERIHNAVKQEGLLKTDQVVGNSVVDMYAKCGSPLKAWEVFEQLPVRNVISWTAIISGYAQLGETASVLTLLARMRTEGIEPNQVTLLSVLSACSHAGLVDNGLSLFEAMTHRLGIVPSVQHLTCSIDLLIRAGQFDKAIEIIKGMPSHFDIVTCLAMLGACRKWGNVMFGRHAFDLAVQLDEREMAPYICMHNIYADAAF